MIGSEWKRRRIGLWSVWFLVLALPAAAQDPSSQIQAKIQEIRQAYRSHPFESPVVPNVSAALEEQLGVISQLLGAGQVYASIEKLGQLMDLFYGARFAAEQNTAVEKGGFSAFDAEWRKASAALDISERGLREADWGNAPAAIRALAEISRAKVLPYMEAGRGFATSTQPKDGLFHVGEAQGQAAFAQFCAGLHVPRKAVPPPRRSLLPELEALQQKTDAAFVPPRSIELHSRFISLNSNLKLARELDAARFYSGALHAYLQATLHYGMLDAVPPDTKGEAALKAAILAAQKKLESSDRDDSIAQLALERAAALVLRSGGAAPAADDWRTSQVIVNQVLPAYFAALKPASVSQPVSGKTVEITLVRWPYT